MPNSQISEAIRAALDYPKRSYEEIINLLPDDHPLKIDYRKAGDQLQNYGYIHNFFSIEKPTVTDLRNFIANLFGLQFSFGLNDDTASKFIRQFMGIVAMNIYEKIELSPAHIKVIYMTTPQLNINRKALLIYMLSIPPEEFEDKVKSSLRYIIMHEFLHVSDLHFIDLTKKYKNNFDMYLRNIAADIRVSALYELMTKSNILKDTHFEITLGDDKAHLIHWSQFYQSLEVVKNKNINDIYDDLQKLAQKLAIQQKLNSSQQNENQGQGQEQGREQGQEQGQKQNQNQGDQEKQSSQSSQQNLPPDERAKLQERLKELNKELHQRGVKPDAKLPPQAFMGKIDTQDLPEGVAKQLKRRMMDALKNIGQGITELYQEDLEISRVDLSKQIKEELVGLLRLSFKGRTYHFFRRKERIYNMTRPLIPQLSSQFEGNVVVLVDTSGSISKEELEFFYSVIHGTFDEVIMLLFADGIYKVEYVRSLSDLRRIQIASGGTVLYSDQLKKYLRMFPPKMYNWYCLTDGWIDLEGGAVELLKKANVLFFVSDEDGENMLKRRGLRAKYIPLKEVVRS